MTLTWLRAAAWPRGWGGSEADPSQNRYERHAVKERAVLQVARRPEEDAAQAAGHCRLLVKLVHGVHNSTGSAEMQSRGRIAKTQG